MSDHITAERKTIIHLLVIHILHSKVQRLEMPGIQGVPGIQGIQGIQGIIQGMRSARIRAVSLICESPQLVQQER